METRPWQELGVYRLNRALAGQYADPTPVGTGQCEHVAFHESPIHRNWRRSCAIYPALTNETPWEHILEHSSTRHVMLQRLTQGDRAFDLVHAVDHKLGNYRAQFPLYDRRLPVLSRLTRRPRPGRR